MADASLRAFRLRETGLYAVIVSFLVLIAEIFHIDLNWLLPIAFLVALLLTPQTKEPFWSLRGLLRSLVYFVLIIIFGVVSLMIIMTFHLNANLVLSAEFLAFGIFCLAWAEIIWRPLL